MRIRFSAVRALIGLGLATSLSACIFTSPSIPTHLSNTLGQTQTVAPNAQAALPLTVQVKDQEGNPKSDVTIQWEIKSGSGTISANETTTNSDGSTSVTFTAGASTGTTVVLAKLPELGAAVSFTMTIK
jgi:hypothetical protein